MADRLSCPSDRRRRPESEKGLGLAERTHHPTLFRLTDSEFLGRRSREQGRRAVGPHALRWWSTIERSRMARILVQTDRGTMTLSEHIEPSNLAEDEYAHGL